jgi:hypothetical protein
VNASRAGSSTECHSGDLLIDLVAHQIDRLIPLLDLVPQASVIRQAYRALCSESLAIEPRGCVPEWSRINTDGTPFQFSLHLNATDRPGLQFLGEAGRPACSPGEHAMAALACLDRLGDLLCLSRQVAGVGSCVESWTQHGASEPGAAMAATLWFALTFRPDVAPTLTIYLNNRWGPPTERWRRLRRLGAQLGATFDLENCVGTLPVAPLGAAVVLRGDGRRSGRAYFSGFGVDVERYRATLSRGRHGERATQAFDSFAQHILSDQACYQTASSVFSLELCGRPFDAVKIELCGHCALDDDRQAATRISEWLRASRMRCDVYQAALATMLGGRTLPPAMKPVVHSFVGIGVRHGEPYASIYLNPGPMVR